MRSLHDRRTFLKSLAVLAGGTVVVPTLRVLPAQAAAGLQRVSEERMLLGTIVGITALSESSRRGEEAMGRAYAEVERLAAILSRFDGSSALSALNSGGRLNGAPQELLTVVEHGRNLHRTTNGLFDATIAPVVDLLQRTGGKPDTKDLQAALALVDANRLTVAGRNLSFGASGMSATLDGNAKGYIADCAAAVLRENGIENFLIDAGGDLRIGGFSDGHSRAWHVAIEDPQKQGRYPDVIAMTSGAVATSGGYEVFFDKDRSSTHLVNPTSGVSPQYVQSVSVQAPTVMQADGMATALSLMSPRQAMDLTRSLPGYECLLVTSTGTVLRSANWGRMA